jgi:hypothetical protein
MAQVGIYTRVPSATPKPCLSNLRMHPSTASPGAPCDLSSVFSYWEKLKGYTSRPLMFQPLKSSPVRGRYSCVPVAEGINLRPGLAHGQGQHVKCVTKMCVCHEGARRACAAVVGTSRLCRRRERLEPGMAPHAQGDEAGRACRINMHLMGSPRVGNAAQGLRLSAT